MSTHNDDQRRVRATFHEVELEVPPGQHVLDAAALVAVVATATSVPAVAYFNGTPMRAEPGDTSHTAWRRWSDLRRAQRVSATPEPQEPPC